MKRHHAIIPFANRISAKVKMAPFKSAFFHSFKYRPNFNVTEEGVIFSSILRAPLALNFVVTFWCKCQCKVADSVLQKLKLKLFYAISAQIWAKSNRIICV